MPSTSTAARRGKGQPKPIEFTLGREKKEPVDPSSSSREPRAGLVSARKTKNKQTKHPQGPKKKGDVEKNEDGRMVAWRRTRTAEWWAKRRSDNKLFFCRP